MRCSDLSIATPGNLVALSSVTLWARLGGTINDIVNLVTSSSLQTKTSQPLMSRVQALIERLPSYLDTFGWRGLLSFGMIRYASSGRPARLYLRNIDKPVWLRPDCSDVLTMREVFLDGDYNIPTENNVQYIVDAGANIGLASIYFANKYPSARIIAVEPEIGNFRMLKKNVEFYPQIVPVNAALWRSSGSIQLSDPGRGEHGFTTSEVSNVEGSGGGEPVAAISMADLMDSYGIEHLDLLKIDIEGAEKEVFEAADGWVDRVSTIVIELHDRFKPGCAESFTRATPHMKTVLERGKLVVKSVKSL